MASPFIRLPRELRDQIYRYVFISSEGIIFLRIKSSLQESGSHIFQRNTVPSFISIESYHLYHSQAQWQGPLGLGLVRVNKQINAEARNLLWKHNTLCVPVLGDWEKFMRLHSLESQLRTQLIHLLVNLDFFKKGKHVEVQKLFERLVKWSHLPSSRLRELDIRITRNKTWKTTRPQHVADEGGICTQIFRTLCNGMEAVDEGDRQVLGRHVKRRLIVGEDRPIEEDVWSFWGSPLNVDKVMVPGSLLRNLHEALGGELWVDGLLSYQDGVRVKAAPGRYEVIFLS